MTWKRGRSLKARAIAKKALPLIPPGEILLEEFMKPNDISQNRLAREEV